jgi:hypothetical protein
VARPDWSGLDDKNTQAWYEQIVMVQARHEGDLQGAARAGATSLVTIMSTSGLEDDFHPLWTRAVLASLDAGLLEQAQEQVAHVADARDGLLSPGLAAQMLRLEGLLKQARGGDPERELRQAVVALGDFGLVPDLARTQHVLAGWLVDQGRTEEAAPFAAAARATYERLGATAWLAELEEHAEAVITL